MAELRPPSASLSTGEFARAVGVSRRLVTEWVLDGHVSATRTPGVRGSYRIPRSELERFARGNPRTHEDTERIT
jgi:excisionase family DNA binding protein